MRISLLFVLAAVLSAAPANKPRIVITADPELDDSNTLIRAMLYSSDMQMEGLIYTSSTFHWKGDGKGTTQYLPGREYTRLGLCPCESWRWARDERFIDRVVEAYAAVYPNLRIHNRDYPIPAALKARIKWGNVAFEGDYSEDTDGSNLIKSLLLDDRPGPLYVTAQGGQSTIARALKAIYEEYAKTAQWQAVRQKVSAKLIVIPSGDQDGTYARYIRPNWPDVAEWQMTTMDFGYFVRKAIPAEDQVYVSANWTRENVSMRGPLGALYRVWGDGKQMVRGDRTDYFGLSGYTADELKTMGYMVWMPPQEKGAFLGEGDTPTFLNLLDNGLVAYRDRRWSGWGGSSHSTAVPTLGLGGSAGPVAAPDDPGVALGLGPAGAARSGDNSTAAAVPPGGAPAQSSTGLSGISAPNAAANVRFFAAAQNDFAARLQWSVHSRFGDANHEPEVRIAQVSHGAARPGSVLQFKAEISDPDGNSVKVLWWQDIGAGTCPGSVRFSDPTALSITVLVPEDAAAGQTIHVILEGTDDGAPPLTRYQRLVVRIQ